MNTLNHYPVTKSIHLFTNQHIVTEPTNHLDTLSIGLVRTRCKCNDVNFFTRYDLDIQDDGDSVIIAGSSEFYPMFLPKGVRPNRVRASGRELETIRQHLPKPVGAGFAGDGYRLEKARKRPKLGPHLSRIEAVLEEDAGMQREHRHTAKRIWQRPREWVTSCSPLGQRSYRCDLTWEPAPRLIEG